MVRFARESGLLAVVIALLAGMGVTPANAVTTYTISGHVYLGDSSTSAGDGVDIFFERKACNDFGGCFFSGGGGPGVRTDANGFYTATLLAGTEYRLHATPRSPGPWQAVHLPSYWLGVVDALVATADRVIDVTLDQGATVTGTVKDSAGSPISGIDVTVADSRQGPLVTRSARTNSSGEFTITLVPRGAFRLTFYSGFGTYVSRAWGATAAAPAGTPFTVDSTATVDVGESTLWRGSTVSGSIDCDLCRDVTAPVMGAVIETRDSSVDPWSIVKSTNVFSVSGAYQLVQIPPGEYRVRVGYGGRLGYVDTFSDPFTVIEGSTNPLPVITVERRISRDFSGDGAVDLLARDAAGTVRLYTGTGSGALVGASSTVASGWKKYISVASPGDFTGDGHSDLVALDAVGRAWLIPGDGAGGWLRGSLLFASRATVRAVFGVGDIDGDGFADLFARRTNGSLSLLRGDGAGGSLGWMVMNDTWRSYNTIFSPGDFDNDGYFDLIGRLPNGDLMFNRSDENGSWLGWQRIATRWGAFTSITGPGDLTGDGHPDLLAKTSRGELMLYPGTGSGGIGAPTRIAIGWGSLTPVS